MDEKKIENIIEGHVNNIRDLYVTGYKDGAGDQQESYKKGLEDAWECARKMYQFTSDNEQICEVLFDMRFNEFICTTSPSEAMTALEEYEKKQAADKEKKLEYLADFCDSHGCYTGCPLATDRFHCGRGSSWHKDTISEFDSNNIDLAYQIAKEYEEIKVGDEVIHNTEKYVVVAISNGSYFCLRRDGKFLGEYFKSGLKKTGEHFNQIEEI